MASAHTPSSRSLRAASSVAWTARALVVALGAGCAGPASTAAVGEPSTASPTAARASKRLPWPDVTRSPWPLADAEDLRGAALAAACGGGDGALARTAQALVSERVRGLSKPDADRVPWLLRAHGEPHVAPRVVMASGRAPLDDEALRDQLAAARGTGSRCGVALARTEQNKELLVAVVVDALADLDPLPTRARVGQWLTLSATLHVPASDATVVVLGPRGLPRAVPTSLDARTGTVRARFAPDQPGAFTVQLVGDLDGGPRPLLEARVFADTAPPDDDERAWQAPGEEAGEDDDGSEALARMIAGLRVAEGLEPLVRDARLDALAQAHVEAMRAAGTIAHDVGGGDVRARFEESGLVARSVGENVARAKSARRAHRALYASPSHRANLLHDAHTHLGVAVVADDAGDLYVCQIFAAGLR